jgi:hypothetical protein
MVLEVNEVHRFRRTAERSDGDSGFVCHATR